MFRPVSAELDFVAIEEAELARWRAHNIFARTMAQREGSHPWVFSQMKSNLMFVFTWHSAQLLWANRLTTSAPPRAVISVP